jgi:endonuclease/exonuclease/phosphatase family metal-dependent hydrolase
MTSDSPEVVAKSSSGRRVRRRAGIAAALLLLWIAGTYAWSRATSPWNAVRIVRHEPPPGWDPSPGRSDPTILRIGCYNIAHGRGSGDENWNGEDRATRDRRLSDIARFLEDADLDVVVLNEVDFDSSWSGRVNQAAAIAARAGYPYRVEQRNFDVAAPFFSLRFGNAILSRHPISEARLVDLAGDAGWETVFAGKKNGCVCAIERKGNEPVRIFAVHLSYRSEAVRVESVRAIIAEADRETSPLIVAGDFNSTPANFPEADPSGLSALDQMLADGRWTTLPTDLPSPADFTFSSIQPKLVIDWILAPKPWELLSRQVYPVEYSDHRPVIGVLRQR